MLAQDRYFVVGEVLMDRNRLRDRIERIRGLGFEKRSEAQVKQFIVAPILECLGWRIDEPGEVDPEYRTGGHESVDYALVTNGTPVVFVEAKAAGENLRSHTEQLLQYAWRQAVPLAVLTNGSDWAFYLSWEKRDWDKRLFWSTNLRTDHIDSVCDGLIQFLSKEIVISGEAAQAAEEKLHGADIQDGMVQAWNALVEESDSSLLDLIARGTEKKCGHKPDMEAVRIFVAENKQHLLLKKPPGGGGNGGGGGGGGEGGEPDDKKAWYYWQDRNKRGYILRFVNQHSSCSKRTFDAENGKFVGKGANPSGDYQISFAKFIRPEQRLYLSRPLSVDSCKERLPDWAMSEFEPQIRVILQSDRKK
jgi:hypothetical protein